MVGQVAPPEPVLSLPKDVEHAHHTQLPTGEAGARARCCLTAAEVRNSTS